MKVTTSIRKESKMKGSHSTIHIPAIIASIFSVLFSLSIIIETKDLVGTTVMAVLGIFTIFFLVINERFKVNAIQSYFGGNKKAILGFVITFAVSVGMSSVGIYLWTNKTFEQEQTLAINTTEQIKEVRNTFLNNIQSVKEQQYENTIEYGTLSNDLIYWKSKRAWSIDERNNIRNHIQTIEESISIGRTSFTKKIDTNVQNINDEMNGELAFINESKNINQNSFQRNNHISYIFLIMILVAEVGILVLNKEIVKFTNKIMNTPLAQAYIDTRSILQCLFLAKNKTNKVNINHALYSPTMNKKDWNNEKKWNETKKLYNLFINLGILDNGETLKSKSKNGILVNNLLLTENEAFAQFDKYYEKLLSIS